ncbi:proline-rich protein 36-like [Anomalospiza imberbis]|uniref:proline-rich protein 36-like n=1 Tax=Anomalospiza imberbis TaxID=187417 RepID=UPI00358F56DD
MSSRTSVAWPKPWNAQQDITAHQEQGLPTSTRVQRAPTATSLVWQTPATAGLVLGAHSVPGQDSQPRAARAGLGISALPRRVCPPLWAMGQGACAQLGISALQGAPSPSPVPAAPSCPSLGWLPVTPACPALLGSSAKEKVWLPFLDRVMLGISVILAPHSQITGTALLASTALKALNSQFPAALEASALSVGRGRQQTVSSAQLGTPAAVLEQKLLSCALLATSVCQGPPSARSIPVPRAPLAPGLVPPVSLTASPAQQGCIAQLQGYPSPLDFVTQVITVPGEPSAQPPSSTGWNPPALPCLAMTSAPWATSVPVAPGTPCRVPPAPCPVPWAWGQKTSASPAQLGGSAVAQAWLSWPRRRCVTQGEWHCHRAVTKRSLAVC